MSFAGMNYWAVLVAAGAAWIFGAGYYGALANHWVAASGRTMDDVMAERGTVASYVPYMLSLASSRIPRLTGTRSLVNCVML